MDAGRRCPDHSFFWLFRALRWFVLLEASGIHIAFSRLYLVGAISVALAILTPLQSGEALKVEFLKKAVWWKGCRDTVFF